MTLTSCHLPKPSPKSPAGFGQACCEVADAVAQRLAARRRRRQLLESYFSPIVSEAAMPSAVDRLVLWRSRHGRNRA